MTAPNYVQRLRVTFRKEGAARWIGHLDVARTWERALNRAAIPMAYTQGFNRRPRMQFAIALPLGYTSSCEYVDLWLGEVMQPQQVQTQLMARMAPGIVVSAVRDVPIKQPKLPMLTAEAVFRAELAHTVVDPAELATRVATFNAADELIRSRRGKKKRMKTYDLRPLVLALAVDETAATPTLIMRLVAKEGGMMGRPDELLTALGYDPLDARIHRQQLILDEPLDEPIDGLVDA